MDTLMGLQAKLDEFPDFLAQTEGDLQEATREGSKLLSEIRRLDFNIDKNYQRKFKTEEAILKLAQEQLITDKASAYRLKLLNNAQEKRRNVDCSLAKVQNQLAQAMLDVEKLRNVSFKTKKKNDEIQESLDKAEAKSNSLEDSLKRIHSQIELKMQRFEKLNSLAEEIQNAFGTEGGNPTEIKVNFSLFSCISNLLKSLSI